VSFVVNALIGAPGSRPCFWDANLGNNQPWTLPLKFPRDPLCPLWLAVVFLRVLCGECPNRCPRFASPLLGR
jgi:hypothetical protein